MSVGIAIPWRTSPDRAPLLSWTIAHLEQWNPRAHIRLGSLAADQPWCKAAAVQDAISAMPSDVSVYIIHDADVLTAGLDQAVRAVNEGPHFWAVPHRSVYRLKNRETEAVLSGYMPRMYDNRYLERKPYIGVEGGGVTVVDRHVWEACPMDARFTGWGQEDEAWGIALRTLFGPPHRSDHPLVHLWHEPQNRMSSAVGSKESRHLFNQYVQASSHRLNTNDMARLVNEGRPEGHGEKVQVQPADGPAPEEDVSRVGEPGATSPLHG